MDLQEYTEKREAYMVSDAPYEVKRKAIEELDNMFIGNKEAMIQIESQIPTYEDLKDVM